MRSPVALILAGRSARAWDEGGRCGGWQLCAFGERCCHLRFSSRCGDVRWPCRFRRSAYSERYSCASWLRSCCSGRHRGNRCAPWWVADYGTLIRFDGCCGRFGCRGGRGDFVTLRYKIPPSPSAPFWPACSAVCAKEIHSLRPPWASNPKFRPETANNASCAYIERGWTIKALKPLDSELGF